MPTDNSPEQHHSLRNRLRQQRRELSENFQKDAAEKIFRILNTLPIYQSSQHVAYYIATEGELSPHLALKQAEESGKQAYLPVIKDSATDKRLAFLRYEHGDPLMTEHYGIPEPTLTSQNEIDPRNLDLVIVPLVAFDENGHRIGRGAGYYDRSFSFLNRIKPRTKPKLIGLAYEFQRLEAIPSQAWDIDLDMVVTEKTVYKAKPSDTTR